MYTFTRKIYKTLSLEYEDGLSTYDIALISQKKRSNKYFNTQKEYNDLLG